MNIGTLTVTLGADMTKMQNGLNKATSALQRFGYVATTALTLPITMAGKAALKMAVDYEYSMQKIVGLTGTAQNIVNGFSKDVLAMGKSVGKSPQELADALYFISSSGIKGAEAMKVLEVSAKAASAGLGETQQVADLLTSVLNAYAGTGMTAAKATDILVAGVREGKAEASGFASAMGQIVPIAAQMGVSFDQVAGGMAAITLTGSSSASAATYLKGVFNSLLTASKQGESALKSANTSYAELRSILAEKGLIALMQKLRDLQSQYGDEMLSDVLPNIRALTGYLSIAGKNFKYNSELIERVRNSSGSLALAWAAVADTAKIKLDKALSSVNASMITFGKSVAEVVIPWIQKAAVWLDKFTKHFESLTEGQKKFRIAMLAVAAAMGPLSLLISSMLWMIKALIFALQTLNGTLALLDKAALVTTSSFSKFVNFLKVNPWLIVVTGILAIVGGIKALKSETDRAMESQNGFNAALVKVNGNLKLMKELSEIDYSGMDFNQLYAVKQEANKGYMTAKANIKTAQSRIDSGEVGAGRMQKYIISQENAALAFKKTYDDANKALDDLANTFESNAFSSVIDDKNKKTALLSQTLLEQKEALERLNDEWGKSYDILKLLDLTHTDKKLWSLPFMEEKNPFKKVGTTPGYNPASIALTKGMNMEESLSLKPFKFNKWSGTADPLSGGSEIIAEAENNYKKQQFMARTTGEYYDDLGSKIEMYKGILGSLYDTYGEGNQYIDEYAGKLKLLQDLFKQRNEEDRLDTELMTQKEYLDKKYQLDMANTELTEKQKFKITQKYQRDIRKLHLENAQMVLQAASDALGALSSLMEANKQKELSAVGDNAKAREAIERKYFEKQKKMAIAQAMINGALAVTNILANIPGSGANPFTWIAIGVTAAAMAAQIGVINAQKMAQGGIVPAGYSNDSYPALLSSGEAVVPPGKLDNLTGGEVVFTIKGDTLVGVLNKRGRKVASYS